MVLSYTGQKLSGGGWDGVQVSTEPGFAMR